MNLALWLDRALTVARRHLGASALVASVVVLVSGQLEGLDAWSFRVASAVVSSYGTRIPVEPPVELPAVLLISDSLYESEYAQTSPLDRHLLAKYLGEIILHHPRALIVDLDLSPTRPGVDKGQQELDQVLINAAKDHIEIVLMTPFPKETEALKKAKFDWMNSLCKRGLNFGLPLLRSQHGVVLRFDRNVPTIAKVLHRKLSHESEDAEEPCTTIQGGVEKAIFLDPNFIYSSNSDSQHLVFFNSKFFEQGVQLVHHFNGIADIAAMPIRNRVVVLGGGYGEDDKHLSLAGNIYGAVLHAAEYASRVMPVKEALPHWIMFLLIEIPLGALLIGPALHMLWHRFYACISDRQGADATVAYGRGLLWLLVFLAFNVMVLLFSMAIMVYILRTGSILHLHLIWCGMLVDAIVSNKSVAVETARASIKGHGFDGNSSCKDLSWANLLKKWARIVRCHGSRLRMGLLAATGAIRPTGPGRQAREVVLSMMGGWVLLTPLVLFILALIKVILH